MREQWNKPDRTDNYLMLIAQRIQQGQARRPREITLKGQEIKFKWSKAESLSFEERKKRAVQASKSRWKAAVGLVSKTVKKVVSR